MQARAKPTRGTLAGRVLLVLLTVWALLLVAPDVLRLFHPLSSLGFAADNDGLIFDVQGPFPTLSTSPAWQAGLREGDRIDLWAMRCFGQMGSACKDLLAAVGGRGGPQLARPGRAVSLVVAAPGQPTRAVAIKAAPVPSGWEDKAVLTLNEVIAILIILGAASLVWTRPGPMTWGFFLYAIWFNSGADYEAYAWLEERPLLLLAQEVMESVAIGAGYAGLLLFALRVPRDRTEPRWYPLERALPLIGAVLIVLQLASFASAFGYRTETITRVGILTGWVINLMVLAILLARRHGQAPQDYQRLRWVIWGCLLGLPAFIFAEAVSSTSMFVPLVAAPLSDAALGLFYLLNGVLVVFVFEAVRRQRVIDVAIPLRRVTLIALLVSVPIFLLGEWISGLQHELDLPLWGWLLAGGLVAFTLARMHDPLAEFTHRMLSPSFRRARHRFEDVGHSLRAAHTTAEVEHSLTSAPAEALCLASAALFRADEGAWNRCPGAPGWHDGTARQLSPEMQKALRLHRHSLCPHRLKEVAEVPGFPHGLESPVLCVPIGDGMAVALYGPHRSGADLNADERELLVRFAAAAEGPYARLEIAALRARVQTLEAQSARVGALP